MAHRPRPLRRDASHHQVGGEGVEGGETKREDDGARHHGLQRAIPVDLGTSILLSAPGLLLALFAFRWRGRTRLGIGTAVAVVLIAVFNLGHFSQGWVQWGYRFSLDFLPFLLPMVALGAARPSDGRPRRVAIVLLVAGGLVNLWGVTWGQILGW